MKKTRKDSDEQYGLGDDEDQEMDGLEEESMDGGAAG